MDRLSFGASVSDAWRRTKLLLFAPFDLNVWFGIGFSAWLSMLGQGGGFSFNYQFDAGQGGANQLFDPLLHWVRENPLLAAAIAAALVLVFLLVYVLLAWLGARGDFMLLDNVITGQPRIRAAWRAHRRPARSLFLFRLVFALVALVLILLVAAGGAALVFVCISRESVLNGAGLALLGLIAVFIFLFTATVLVALFLTDFVVPLMLMRRCGVREGWRFFFDLSGEAPWTFLSYAMMKTLLQIGLGAVFLLAMLFTCCFCCVGGILLVIPYVNAVVLLPFSVFFRYLPLSYLAGGGAEYDAYGLADELLADAGGQPGAVATAQVYGMSNSNPVA